MTATLKKNKPLRIFTFILLLISIIGALITLFLNTEYALAFQSFLKRNYKKLIVVYNSLTPDQKQALKTYATKAVHLSQHEVLEGLKKAGVEHKTAFKIVNTGSAIVREVIKKAEQKIK